jgi:hypothetical protein
MNTTTPQDPGTAPVTRAGFDALRSLLAQTLNNMVQLMDNLNDPEKGADLIGVVNKLIYRVENDFLI